jgi:hypothetical protein
MVIFLAAPMMDGWKGFHGLGQFSLRGGVADR